MKVEIINKSECTELFKYWGLAAAKCYASPPEKAVIIGKGCLKTGHFSGSRGRYIMFDITEVPRALVDQLVRHEIGVFKNVESGRYVDFSNFSYYTDPIIDSDEVLSELYHNHMRETRLTYGAMVLRLNDLGYHGEKAYEIARGVSPMNYNTGLVIGMTIEALINFCNERLCVCSQEHIRKLAVKMKEETLKLLPELKNYLVPSCAFNGWCPENPRRSCGAYPQKDVVLQLVKDYMKEIRQ